MLAVDEVGGEQANRAIGLLGIGAPEDTIIRDTEFDTGTDEDGDFVREHEGTGTGFAS